MSQNKVVWNIYSKIKLTLSAFMLQPNRGRSIGNRCSCSRFNGLGDVYSPALRAIATSSISRFAFSAPIISNYIF
ncbi:hypothetical protein [Nostoc sp.]|uniref:hypothetical protein n=1 Tax=Nostoc sp. TaxID=1180 RepID=UPI002FF9A468